MLSNVSSQIPGSSRVTIVGGGLAGCEAALTLASHGVGVRLIEQKPLARTPAQISDQLCELVCSNSLRGADLTNAVGLLKEEMRRLGSFVMKIADRTRVPAGSALAVDRELFSRAMTELVDQEPLIERVAEVVTAIPEERPLILATGPLTGDALAEQLATLVGREALAYYDAISPIVSADSIDWDKVFVASRWDRGEDAEDRAAYVNCPMNRAEYEAFVEAVRGAEKVEPKSFEDIRYFEGCLPIEVMAERGARTLAFGPMKPVGLTDPRTGRWPYAVVQLRKEDEAGTAYNLVGFQTRMTWPEQRRVLRTIPGLAAAEFERYGSVHRNTFLNAPLVLDASLQARAEPGVYFAGQVTGTEGYVEAAASGWLCAHFVRAALCGIDAEPPPPTTAHGGLLAHLGRPTKNFQPSNITFSLVAPFEQTKLKKRDKYQAMAERALRDLADWTARQGMPRPQIKSRATESATIQ